MPPPKVHWFGSILYVKRYYIYTQHTNTHSSNIFQLLRFGFVYYFFSKLFLVFFFPRCVCLFVCSNINLVSFPQNEKQFAGNVSLVHCFSLSSTTIYAWFIIIIIIYYMCFSVCVYISLFSSVVINQSIDLIMPLYTHRRFHCANTNDNSQYSLILIVNMILINVDISHSCCMHLYLPLVTGATTYLWWNGMWCAQHSSGLSRPLHEYHLWPFSTHVYMHRE